jgi:N-acetylmuramoyl-L-alanine amidase
MFEFQQNRHMEQSVKFASEIQQAFKKIGRGDRSVKQAGLLVLRKTGMPAVLVELGFISNPAEENFMRSAAGQNKLARAIYDAFRNYKKEYDRMLAATTPPPAVRQAGHRQTTQKEEVKERKNVTVYRIQIMASNKQLTAHSKHLKGYKDIGYIKDKGLYKYMYAESIDLPTIQNILRKIKKDFKDAFIVPFSNNEKVTPLKKR